MVLSLLTPPITEQDDPVGIARFTAPRVLTLWHLASLDAPTVAIIWTLGIAWSAGVRLGPWIPMLIACGTWSVYVGDRLLDARRAIRSGDFAPLRERHYFHWRHRRKLLPIAAVTTTVATLLISRLLPLATREHDSVIAGAALAYLSGVHSKPRLPAWLARMASKEFLVGVLFTAGCAAPTFSHLRSPAWPVLSCVACLAALAWLNCTAIECWESQIENTKIPSLAGVISCLCLIVAMALSPAHAHTSTLAYSGALTSALLLLVDRNRHRIDALTLRALADLVLLTPAILLASGVWRP